MESVTRTINVTLVEGGFPVEYVLTDVEITVADSEVYSVTIGDIHRSVEPSAALLEILHREVNNYAVGCMDEIEEEISNNIADHIADQYIESQLEAKAQAKLEGKENEDDS